MAAAQIMVASGVPLSARLRAISASSHWRHVLRIAVSRISHPPILLTSDQTLSQFAIAWIMEILMMTRVSYVQAHNWRLILLDDGISVNVPSFQRQLVRGALTYLGLGGDSIGHKMARHFSTTTQAVFRECLIGPLRITSSRLSKAAWSLLFQVRQQNAAWADELISDYWPEDPVTALHILENTQEPHWAPSIREHARASQWKSKVTDTMRLARYFYFLIPDLETTFRLKCSPNDLFILPVGLLEGPFRRPAGTLNIDFRIMGDANKTGCRRRDRMSLNHRQDFIVEMPPQEAHPTWRSLQALNRSSLTRQRQPWLNV